MIEFGDERIPQRIWSKITISDGHWLWTGAIAGVPQTRWKVDGVQKTVSVRRILFELATGTTAPAIGGCRCECVNPAHAVAGTAAEVAASWDSKQDRTKCVAGHVLGEVGIYFSTVRGRKVRKCSACHAIHTAAKRDKRRRRRLASMSPERREKFLRKSETQRRLWASGAVRRRDGSITPLAGVQR